MEMVEGKYQPHELGAQEYLGYGMTTGLMLHMMKPYFGAGKCVVLDSGFCVLKALVELKRHCICACALIKKCQFWPSQVPGAVIDDYMADREIVDVDATKVLWGCNKQIVGGERAQLYYEDEGYCW
jgi:hypothetical protein